MFKKFNLPTKKGSSDTGSASPESTPTSPILATSSPTSTAPTSPDIDSSSGKNRPSLFGRGSSFVKGKIPSTDSFIPTGLLDTRKSPLGSPNSAGKDETTSSDGLVKKFSSMSVSSLSPSISVPSISIPSMPSAPFSLPTGYLQSVLEMFGGSTSIVGFGSLAEMVGSLGKAKGLPGLRRLDRAAHKADQIGDDLVNQAIERRKQLWKLVIVAANGVALPDIPSFSFITRAKTFTLKPPTRGSIPLQWIHRGPGAIDDALANTPSSSLGVEGLLKNLNEIHATKYTLADKEGLENLLQLCISRSYDFGRTYGMVRPAWPSGDFAGLPERWERWEEKDKVMRDNARVGTTVVHPRIPPRRVWDLHSNRVLPFWSIIDSESQLEPELHFDPNSTNIPDKLWAISHAWVHEDDRKDPAIRTVINNEKWPVPLPKDSSLEHVRIELLNLGAEYVWLDVLCLMQEDKDDPKHEEVRLEEWKLDVPTIGHVYQHDRYQTVITYFNGLGRPFNMGPKVIRGDRYWINRVWTLQETTPTWLPAGMTLSLFDSNNPGEVVRPGLYEQIKRLAAVVALNPPDIFSVISAVRDRSYSNEKDRLGAVGYVLKIPTLPTYEYTEDVETVWPRLLFCLSDKHRTDILVLYPLRGDAETRWAPSWYQLMQLKPPSVTKIPYNSPIDPSLDNHDLHPRGFLSSPDRTEYVRCIQTIDTSAEPHKVTYAYFHHAYVIRDCHIRLTDAKSGVLRITVDKDRKAVKYDRKATSNTHEFKMSTDHDQPIGTGEYVLVGVARMKYWVLGKRIENVETDATEYEVEKLSVIRVHNPSRNELIKLDPGIAEAKVTYK